MNDTVAQPLSQDALDQAFYSARTFNKFTDAPVPDELLHKLHDLMKWGPTSMNCQPMRLVFVRPGEARQKLIPLMSPGNQEKTTSAPIVVIAAQDTRFFDHLPTQFKAMDAKPMFEGNEALSTRTAALNSALQIGYFILAARMLGLDCGPMAGFDAAKVDAEFFAGQTWKSMVVINLGYGDASGNYPRGPRLAFDDVARIV